ncbi:hypothetical protein [Streptomyces sp. NBC_00454]|uniref:hypothetical protein n=1 Tax=Streptomyces sp. NBC_00454 TaxID=2975747 RepID=UPI0030E1EAA3
MLALIHVVVAAPPANASVNNLRFGTWNMQGADGGRKWTEMVPGLFRTPGTFNDRNAVMALQEIGSAPSGTSVSTQAIRADYTNRLTNTVVHNTVDVNENLIEIGGEFYSLFWAITDSNGAAGVPGRVNVGIMVRNSRLNGQTPQPVVIQPDTTSNGSLPRPMIGVRIGADVYYSIHAWSGGGNDRDLAIAAVNDNTRNGTGPGGEWAVAGDFNFDLQTGTWIPQYGNLRRSNEITHPGLRVNQRNSELDYAVTSSQPAAGFGATRIAVQGSDHYPVQFNTPFQAQAEQGFTYRFRAPSNDEYQIRTPTLGTAGGSRDIDAAVEQSQWTHTLGQVWQAIRLFDMDGRVYSQLVNVNANKCLDIGVLALTPAYRVVQKDCAAAPANSQLWNYNPTTHALTNADGMTLTSGGVTTLLAYNNAPPVNWEREPVDLRYWETNGFPNLSDITFTDTATQHSLAEGTDGSGSISEGSLRDDAQPPPAEHWRIEPSGITGGSHIVDNSTGDCLTRSVAPTGGGLYKAIANGQPCVNGSKTQAWEYDDLQIRTTDGFFLANTAISYAGATYLALEAVNSLATRWRYNSYGFLPIMGHVTVPNGDSSVSRADSFLGQAVDRYGSNATLRVPQSYTGGHFSPGTEFGPTGYQASFTYDNALVITAFLQRRSGDDISRAIALGDTLLYAQAHDIVPDGRLRASYEPEPFVTATGNPYVGGFSVYTGNMAWAGMAFTRLYKATGEHRFLDGATRIAEWIQANAADDRGVGGYTGGMRNDDQTGAEMIPIRWKATEHNIDTGAFFAMLAAAGGDQTWKSRSDNAFAFVASMQADDGRLWTGTGLDGVTQNRDTVPEDIQTWSYLATLNPAYATSVDWAATNLAATDGPFTGVSFSRTDTSKVWFEGTAHLLAAYQARKAPGDTAKATTLLNTLQLAQSQAPNADGSGLVAASNDGLTTGEGDIYYSALHTGATAWYIIAAEGGNPFRL